MKRILIILPFIALVLTSCLDIDEPSYSSSMTVKVGDLSFEMIYVKGGTFTMGAYDSQLLYARKDEKPAHKVTLGAFYICKTEITAAVWNAVMNDNLPGGNNFLPAAGVSYNRLDSFITTLSRKTGYVFALPTEAQWEYAARGGNDSGKFLYSGSDIIDNVAVYDTVMPFPVGRLGANALGLNDMSGNVAEWCYDWYDKYSDADQNIPYGPESGTYRVVRGGSYLSSPDDCRVSARSFASPDSVSPTIGFRLIAYP
ncbi:MAG: formylglycine-generating enzyme family protein [Paludibacteraceae bacterium]|nr:formylglycine-generating enzyme family protein [Paludibacteraceae bacterium]